MRVLFCFILLFLYLAVLGQDQMIDHIYSEAIHVSMEKYMVSQEKDHIRIESAFSDDFVEKVPISEQRIVRIDLVFTAYRESTKFNQEELNKNRLKQLIAINPQLVENKFFEWRLIQQTGCNSPVTCSDYFHGFIIYYEPYFTKEDTKKEIDMIKQDLSQLEAKIAEKKSLIKINVQDLACQFPPLNTSLQYISDEFKKYYQCDERFQGRVFFEIKVDDKGRPIQVDIKGSLFPCKEVTENILKYILRWKRGLTLGSRIIPFTASGMIEFPLQRECIVISDLTLSEKLIDQFNVEIRGFTCTAYQVDTLYNQIIPEISKEVVSTVLFRNQWKDDLIITDATGSMYPYTSDLLKWMRLQSTEKEKTYVFFNDGDDKPTNQKVIGNTGGIYHVVTSDFVEARETLFKSMNKGGGGDQYENNFEALLYGVKVSGNNSAVMIADNYSFPRDHELLKDFNGDLKIILCGTEKGINTHYLNLAYHYGFSIHTLHSDLAEIKQIQPGKVIQIDKYRYMLGPNGFKPLL